MTYTCPHCNNTDQDRILIYHTHMAGDAQCCICKEHFPTNPEIQESTPIIHGYSEFFHAD